uniref:Uncharacterized protein n=1 Tax=Anopheles farauti TaxID=69004 RepID=A0A182QM68_9DIPT
MYSPFGASSFSGLPKRNHFPKPVLGLGGLYDLTLSYTTCSASVMRTWCGSGWISPWFSFSLNSSVGVLPVAETAVAGALGLRNGGRSRKAIALHAETVLVGGVLHLDHLPVRCLVRVGALLHQNAVRIILGRIFQVAGLLVHDVIAGLDGYVGAGFVMIVQIMMFVLWKAVGGCHQRKYNLQVEERGFVGCRIQRAMYMSSCFEYLKPPAVNAIQGRSFILGGGRNREMVRLRLESILVRDGVDLTVGSGVLEGTSLDRHLHVLLPDLATRFVQLRYLDRLDGSLVLNLDTVGGLVPVPLNDPSGCTSDVWLTMAAWASLSAGAAYEAATTISTTRANSVVFILHLHLHVTDQYDQANGRKLMF